MGGLDTGRLRLCTTETGVAMLVDGGLCMARHGVYVFTNVSLFPHFDSPSFFLEV